MKNRMLLMIALSAVLFTCVPHVDAREMPETQLLSAQGALSPENISRQFYGAYQWDGGGGSLVNLYITHLVFARDGHNLIFTGWHTYESCPGCHSEVLVHGTIDVVTLGVRVYEKNIRGYPGFITDGVFNGFVSGDGQKMKLRWEPRLTNKNRGVLILDVDDARWRQEYHVQ